VVPPPPQHDVPQNDLPVAVPAYVALDRMVLRFFAYFKEAVHESRAEHFRVRKTTILYYLEDNTIQVNEPKEENSGIPQGVLIKRHHVPSDKKPGTFFTVEDLALGQEITCYGRTFRIVDCDGFTAEFFDENGLHIGEPEDYPYNPHDAVYNLAKEREVASRGVSSVKTDDLMHWTEAMLGRPTHLVNEDKLAQFLQYDRKVLRFYCLWDDTPALYGENRKFVLHYYLADDTVEIVESYSTNSGRDPFPKLLNRQRMPCEWDKPGRKEFVTAADLFLGSTVNVYGRELLICDCDDFTSEFMHNNFGMPNGDDNVISLEEPRPDPPVMEIPPYTGFGSEEDSLGSFYSLVPKAPKANWAKYFENDKKILRFVSQLDTRAPEDRERLFIISYYLADDTMTVYEPPARNAGHLGGKWMERCRVKKPNSIDNELYKAKDMGVGVMIELRKHRFCLIEADEYTLNFMENKKFPASDVTQIVNRLKDKFLEQSSQIRKTFRNVDKDHSGSLDMEEFKLVLKKFNFDLTDQEVISVMRKFDPNCDGTVRYDEFCANVLEADYKQVESSGGGQVLHGEQDFLLGEKKQQQAIEDEQLQAVKERKLEELLEHLRSVLITERDQCADLFREVDGQGDGHVDYEAFAHVLRGLPGLTLNDDEIDLMMECFYDPDHQDQTRPMSLVVLDEAIFR
jgi:Ca2+-binding EF-hand superfamily protein